MLWQSLKISNALTKNIDKANFTIRASTGEYSPNLGNEVIIYNGATKIFGGLILSINEDVEAFGVINYQIDCVDYTRLLNAKLIAETYENQTVNAIIADIFGNYAPAGFTLTNVNCPIVLDYIQFNYAQIADCLKQLAQLVNYDWYVDYEKDLHFFAKEANAAPFALNDDDGSYVYNSLNIKKDNSQIKNVVIVRGGEYLGDTLTAHIKGNGTDFMFPLPYRYNDISATLSTTALNIGIDFSGDPDNYDVLWNRDEKVLKFKEIDVPSATAVLRVWGQPFLPVIVKQYNRVAIQSMVSAEGGSGEYEYIIIDENLNSREGARKRAAAELYAYARTISEGEFETEVDGLRSGQTLVVNSVSRGLSESYVINKVSISMMTPTTFRYKVNLITTRTFGMLDLLRELLQGKRDAVTSRTKEVMDLIEGGDELITLTEGSQTISKVHNPVSESMAMSETTSAQSLDYDVDFVVGPYVWGGFGSGDHKRQFNVDGSIIE